MNTSQVLDRTFYLYRKNFVLFAGIAILPPGLMLIGQLVMLMGMRPFFNDPNAVSRDPAMVMTTFAAAGLGFFVLLVLAGIGYAFASGASVCAVSRVHLGGLVTISEAYRMLRPHLGSILGIVILLFIGASVVMFGVILAIVIPIVATGFRPGQVGFTPALGIGIFIAFLLAIAGFIGVIFLSTKFSLAIPACVVENLSVTDSLKRSWNLTQGTFWRLVLVFILTAAISMVVSLVLSIPYFIGLGVMAVKGNTAVITPLLVWQYMAEFLARTLAFPISTIAPALIYYDQRVRKEAFDLQLMMDVMGQPVPVPVPAPMINPTTPGLG